jgi:multidrug efflux pump subunit AcrA (membrane-fusion protein)
MNRLRLAFLVTTILAGGCTHRSLEDVETTAAAPVTVMKVEPQTVRSVVTAAGSVAAAPGADWTITAPEAARIVELPKAEANV